MIEILKQPSGHKSRTETFFQKISEISKETLRPLAFILAGCGIGCGGTANSESNDDGGANSDHDADFAPRPDLNADKGVNDSLDSISSRECPDDKVIPKPNTTDIDCFEFGCFDDIVSQTTQEEIEQIRRNTDEPGQNIIEIRGNESAVIVGNSDILMTSVFGCVAVFAFGRNEGGQLVRGLTHISIDGPASAPQPDYESSSESSGKIFDMLKKKMRRTGGAVGTISYYIFTGSANGSSVGYLQSYLEKHNNDVDCEIGFRHDLLSRDETRGLRNYEIDTFSAVAEDGTPRIRYALNVKS